MRTSTLRFSKLLVGAAALVSVAITNVYAQDPLKMGYIYVGPVGDHGWTYAHDQGRLAIQKEFGDKIKTHYIENVPETADAERVIRSMAQSGDKVIFGTSFGYMNQMYKVAKSYPNTIFMHATGYKTAKNMGTYDIRTYQGAYLLGVVAGKMSKTNKLGVVGSIPVPEVIRNINAFTLGARSVNPAITTRAIWVNSWFAPGKEREAAQALITQGCDVLMQNTDSPAVVKTALEKGVMAFGWDSDMSEYGGKAQLAASVLKWGKIYEEVTKEVMAGKWKPTQYWWGVSHGAIDIENFGPLVPADVQKLALERRDAIGSGKLHPFTGPIKDQSGKEVVPAGTVMTDAQLHSMNFYVQGVEGQIPN